MSSIDQLVVLDHLESQSVFLRRVGDPGRPPYPKTKNVFKNVFLARQSSIALVVDQAAFRGLTTFPGFPRLSSLEELVCKSVFHR